MSEIILALDFSTREQALHFARQVKQEISWVKVGLELFAGTGPAILEELKKLDFNIFLDLKFFDIPNTVKGAVKNILNSGMVDMFTIHLLGGQQMVKEAVSIKNSLCPKAILLGVTVLTSLEQKDLFLEKPLSNLVLALAEKALEWGVDGIVSSPLELEIIRNFYSQLITVTPGIRLKNDAPDDQKRTLTPYEATKKGANFLVIGRSITTSPQPLQTINHIKKQIQKGVHQ
ncbi:MAG: orotidine-5'-phosphate decarboxylase [Desulfonauticus sp.]|nr:orotidine-5'-phosphate decarboxylase [Desulfonauticus sp.]